MGRGSASSLFPSSSPFPAGILDPLPLRGLLRKSLVRVPSITSASPGIHSTFLILCMVWNKLGKSQKIYQKNKVFRIFFMASWEGCVCARQYTNGFLFPFRAELLKQKREISKVVVPKKLGFFWINRFFILGWGIFHPLFCFIGQSRKSYANFGQKLVPPYMIWWANLLNTLFESTFKHHGFFVSKHV